MENLNLIVAMVTSQGSKVLLLEPNVMVENVSEEVTGTKEDNFEIDLDKLKKQHGIDQIFDKLNSYQFIKYQKQSPSSKT